MFQGEFLGNILIYVWLLFKSGIESRTGYDTSYDGVRAVISTGKFLLFNGIKGIPI